MAYTSYSYSHKSAKFTVQFRVDKNSKKCGVRIKKNNNSHYAYNFNARIMCGNTTVCSVSTGTTTMDNKSYTSSWSSGTATGASVTLQVQCGDTDCTTGWGSKTYHSLKTIPFTTKVPAAADKYFDASGDFAFNSNTTSEVQVWISAANAAQIQKVTGYDSNKNPIYSAKTTVSGWEFSVTASTSTISANEYNNGTSDAMQYITVCNQAEDPDDFYIASTGAWLAWLRDLDPNTGYSFQLWYTDDVLSGYKLLNTHWYATSCMPTITAVGGTSSVTFEASTGAWAHGAANADTLTLTEVAVTNSMDMPIFEGYDAQSVTAFNGTFYNLPSAIGGTTYYAHVVKERAGYVDYNSYVRIPVIVGHVEIFSAKPVSHATTAVAIRVELGGRQYTFGSGWTSAIDTSTDKTILSYIKGGVEKEVVRGFRRATEQSPIDFSVPMSPHTIDNVVVRFREYNSNYTQILSEYNVNVTVASNVNVVKVGNNWAIPKVFTNTGWKYTKAKVFVGSTWHDTREAHYNYTTKRWEV